MDQILTENNQKSSKIAKMGCPFFRGAHFPGIKRKIAYPEAHGLFAGQKPPEAALAADKTSVVSAAKKAATSDISIPSTTPRGRRRRPRGVVDPIEMSDVAAFLAADTTDVLSAAKAADSGFCPAEILMTLPRWPTG